MQRFLQKTKKIILFGLLTLIATATSFVIGNKNDSSRVTYIGVSAPTAYADAPPPPYAQGGYGGGEGGGGEGGGGEGGGGDGGGGEGCGGEGCGGEGGDGE